MSAKELNIGDYVRTKYGTIGKISKKEPFMDTILIFLDNKQGNITLQSKDGVFKVNHIEDIIKNSSNILDLIEVGDYVNGHRIIDFMLENGKRKGIIVDADIWGFDIDEIKSIVTKEQFEAMKYKIGE